MSRPPLPSLRDFEGAIAIAEDNLRNHREWLAWRQRGHAEQPLAGDATHHFDAIAEYGHILDVLRRSRDHLYRTPTL